MMDSAAATFGYSSGSGGAAVSNFFAFTENWTQGLKVYSTRIEPPYPKWYFAEGYTGTWWDEYLTLANPNNFEIKVMVEYMLEGGGNPAPVEAVSYTHLRAHETRHDLVCRLLLEKKKQQ